MVYICQYYNYVMYIYIIYNIIYIIYMYNIYVYKTVLYVSPQCPFLIADHIFGKKVLLVGIRQKFYPKILPVMYTFCFTIMSYLKKYIGIKFPNTK